MFILPIDMEDLCDGIPLPPMIPFPGRVCGAHRSFERSGSLTSSGSGEDQGSYHGAVTTRRARVKVQK